MSKAYNGKKGAVMVFAVILMTAGVFVLAAVLQTAATQGISGETEWLALDRRVTLANSRAMAREYLRNRLFRVPQDTNAWPAVFTNSFGGFSIEPSEEPEPNYWTALSASSEGVVLNINPFNLMERGGFYREVFVAELDNGLRQVNWSFALRTRSPVAAGYSFTQHRPAENELASLADPPYIDMNSSGEQFIGYHGLPRMPVASVTNIMTRGAGDTNGFQGYLDATEGATVFGIFSAVTFEPRNNPVTELEVRLDLSEADPNVANATLRYDVPPTGPYDSDGDGVDETYPVRWIALEGTDELRKPLHIVVSPANTNTVGLTLVDDNSRLVYFYRAKAANNSELFDLTSSNAGSWRLGITMSQCDIQFDIDDLEVIGGIRTDGVMIPAPGSLGSFTFVPEVDPQGLDFIGDRMMWLEDYRAQQ